MVSASLNVYYTKLHLRHPATTLFTMELLKGSLTRYNNHTKSFRHRECMNETKLSKHVWNLTDHALDNSRSWEIHKKASPYQCGSKHCDLCVLEKVSIIWLDPDTLLSRRTELISNFRHRNKK